MYRKFPERLPISATMFSYIIVSANTFLPFPPINTRWPTAPRGGHSDNLGHTGSAPRSEKHCFFLDHDYSKKAKFWETLKVISVIRYGRESLNKPLKNIVNMISFFMSPLQHCATDRWLLKRVEL